MRWFLQDTRFAFRKLLADRSFLITAVLALALGIGSTTAIFSVIYNVLLSPFPYTDGNRLMAIVIHDKAQKEPFGRESFSVPEFLDYQEQNHVFDRSIGVRNTPVLMTGNGAPESFNGATVTENTFDFLGVPPAIGRASAPADVKPGAPSVAVLSYKLWQSRFAGDRKVVGKTFILNDKPTTIVGVMPQRFAWWGSDLWIPSALTRSESGPTARYFFLLGHLKPGISEKQAMADLQVLANRFSKLYPENYPKAFDVGIQSLADKVVGQFRTTLYTLLAAVSLLLLIACANVANLLLARATAREKEFAIRTTLGAGRWRIVRQLLVESIWLALCGAVVGCAFAWAGLQGLIALTPKFTFPDEAVIGLNLPVLLAAVATAIVTAVLFGLAPALGATRRNVNEPLKTTGRGNSGFRRGRVRNALIVTEVALSLVLLTGAGLLMRSFLLSKQIDLGFRTEHILTTQLQLSKHYKTQEQQAAFLRDLLSRVDILPGVLASAGAVAFPPFGGVDSDLDIAGKTHSDVWKGQVTLCSASLANTLGTRILKGRMLTEDDISGKRKVAVINQTMVAKYFSGGDPIGKQIKLSALSTAPVPVPNPWFEIVGVVSDMKNHGVREDVVPEAFAPYTFTSYGGYVVFVRAAGNPLGLSKALTAAILSVDKSIIPEFTNTMAETLDLFAFSKPRFGLILFSVFAAVGLILVSVGVYSVISYTVMQQNREIGIRMALGAKASDVRGLVMLAGLRFIGMGVAIGLMLAFFIARALASQFWGVKAYDPITLVIVTLLLTLVGLIACYVPSRRATRVNPMVSLRYE